MYKHYFNKMLCHGTFAVLKVNIVCECEADGSVLLVLLVVNETSEVTAMPRELAEH